GVRLDEVALLFERRHLVADGRRRHRHARRAGDVARPHGLGRGDVLVHDSAEDGGLAIVQHLGSRAYRVPAPPPAPSGNLDTPCYGSQWRAPRATTPLPDELSTV